jgi:hypothetical protein
MILVPSPQAGVRKTMVIALRDNLGNAQKPDDSRRLDDLELTIGELTCLPGLNGSQACGLGNGWPCGWVPQVCVNLTQGCVNLTQGCVNPTQGCVNLGRAGWAMAGRAAGCRR